MRSQCDVSVSVIIPSRNRRDELRRCLGSVAAQKGCRAETLVVDNGSTDGTAEMVRSEFPGVILLRNSTNLGAATARNQALRIARGRYAWFLDSDSVVGNTDCLSTMVRLMEEHPKIGALGGELLRDAAGRVSIKLNRILVSGDTGATFLAPEAVELRDCDYLATCNCFVRRELLDRIGGFDPAYFYLSEDKDLGFQIRRLGYRNVCDHRTAVLHDINLTERRSLYLKCRNTVRFAIKNLPPHEVAILPISTLVVRARLGISDRLRSGEPAALKYIPGKHPVIVKLVLLSARYIFALAGAFVWNALRLPFTLRERFAQRNHIADAPEALRDED